MHSFLLKPDYLPLFPVSTYELAEFLAHRYEEGCGAATLAGIASAVAYGHKIRALPDPSGDFLIRQMLMGARRLRPAQDTRVALSVSDLGRLCDALTLISIPVTERLAYRAIFTLAFFALLRPCEVVCGGNRHYLRFGGVCLNGDRLSISIPSSKTSSSPFTTQLVARPDIKECPVAAMREFLRYRGSGSLQDACFITDNGRPITGNKLNRILRQVGRLTGLEHGRLSAHCLRIGGASHGADIGMSVLQLEQAGRWSSGALRRYLRRPVSVLSVTPSGDWWFPRSVSAGPITSIGASQ